MSEEWKSPRKVEEEVRNYKRERFEYHMTQADEGKITRELAIKALEQELSNIMELQT